MATVQDYAYMARALSLARRGLYTTDPNPRVGCVLVNADRIVGEGWHQRAGEGHAEVLALAAAGSQARNATAYITLEPCCHHGRTPPCTQALLAAGIRRVVSAMQDPNPQVAGQGLAELRAAGVQTECGILEQEARQLNPGFIMRMTQRRPFVRCKQAMSLDGRTAMASGESQWITGEAARLDVQHWRARAAAVMTGVGTILADDPALTVRLAGESLRQPLRVILDPELATPPFARTLKLDGQVLIFTAVTAADRRAPLEATGAQLVTAPRQGLGLELRAVLSELARREINELHLECGAILAGAMLQAGLIDELLIYLAPILLGDDALGLFHLPELRRMSERIPLQIIDVRAIGRDWRFTARPVSGVVELEL